MPSPTTGSDGRPTPQGIDRTAARAAELDRLERLARLMDSRFRLPGTNIRFGLDALIGLVPGIGDTLTAVPGAYILYRAHAHGAGNPVLMRMAGNLAIDYVIGAIPLVGDIFDVGFRANRRNVDLLRAHFEQKPGAGSIDR